MRTLLKRVWSLYKALCLRYPLFTVGFNQLIGNSGRFKVHPLCARMNWASKSCQVTQMLEPLLFPGANFMDVGANWGQFSLLASRHVGPHGKIAAFEPAPSNLSILNFNLRANGLDQTVRVEAACVGAAQGEVSFGLIEGGLHTSNSASFDVDVDVPHVTKDKITWIQCPVVSLDQWCDAHQFRPDVLKVDVEGFELEVLKGAKQTLTHARPIIVIGIHPFWWPKSQEPDAIQALLKAHDYVCLNASGQRCEPTEFADYAFVPAEKESSWNTQIPTRSKE